MHRSSVLVGAVSCVLVAGTGAVAHAAPPENHFSFTDSFTDDNFCGTGETVVVTFQGKGTFHEKKDGTAFVTVQGKGTFTAEETGKRVISHFAQRASSEFIENGDGTVTIIETITGLPEQFRFERGRLITRDAGTITFTITFDEETGGLIDEDITFRGPHPQAESDFELFCEVIPEALGIA